MNLEEYLAKIIKLAKKNYYEDLDIFFDCDEDKVSIAGYSPKLSLVIWVDWHLCKSLDEQPNKEELKSFLKKF